MVVNDASECLVSTFLKKWNVQQNKDFYTEFEEVEGEYMMNLALGAS